MKATLLLRWAYVHHSNEFLHSERMHDPMQALLQRPFGRCSKIMLSSLSTLPGLQNAFLTDVHGHVLASCGGDPAHQHIAIAAVLVQALVSAAEEIGKRSTLGEFTELQSTYQTGGVFVQASADAAFLLVIVHDSGADLQMFRDHGLKVLTSEISSISAARQPAAPARPIASLMDALAADEPH